MSTISSISTNPAPAHRAGDPTAAVRTRPTPPAASFVRLVTVETRKMLDTRAGRVLLVIVAAVTAGAVALVLFNTPAGQVGWAALIASTTLPQALLLPVLGILVVTGEWSQRTALVTFTLEPRRARVVLAKLVAAWLVGLVAVTVALAVAALTNLVSGGAWDLADANLGGLVLAQLIAVTQGVAFGLLIQNSAAAIALSFVLPTGWSFVVNLVDALRPAAPWVDLTTASLTLLGSDLPPVAWAHLGTAVALWVGLPLGLGMLRLLRCELK